MKRFLEIFLTAFLAAIIVIVWFSWTLERQTKEPLVFIREGEEWVLYKLNAPTGLRVPHQENPYAEGQSEQMIAALSPNGQKIAFMQKPAWPHTINVAKIDGSDVRALFTPELPAHTFIENGFTWLDDRHLMFSTTSSDAGPMSGKETAELYKINVETGEKEVLTKKALEWQNENEFYPLKIIPVAN